jgi:hypothetical protein
MRIERVGSYHRHLRHVQLSDLSEMALKLGEVAALKDAVDMWLDGN